MTISSLHLSLLNKIVDPYPIFTSIKIGDIYRPPGLDSDISFTPIGLTHNSITAAPFFKRDSNLQISFGRCTYQYFLNVKLTVPQRISGFDSQYIKFVTFQIYEVIKYLFISCYVELCISLFKELKFDINKRRQQQQNSASTMQDCKTVNMLSVNYVVYLTCIFHVFYKPL